MPGKPSSEKQEKKPASNTPWNESDILMNAPVGIFVASLEGRFISANKAQAEMLGYDSPEELTDSVTDIGTQVYTNPDDWDDFRKALKRQGDLANFECRFRRRDGSVFWVSINARAVADEAGEADYCQGFTTDISDRKLAEEQALQLRKSESLGQLAGDIAHDYNNMLSVIHGYTEVALEKVFPDDPLRGYLEEIQDAARRATFITRQLLAYSGKQAVDPQVLNLNDTLDDIMNMIQRLLGEEIEIVWAAGKNLWLIEMDPVQIDQIIAALCVNAGDAMDGSGKLTIETENVSIDEAYCANNTEARPGDYVMLAVTDEGHGMDRETRQNIFRPFFTTKGAGDHMGLSLATVYGIVRQNSGFIYVYSEPGQGSTFKIYLPRYADQPERIDRKEDEIPRGLGETVLVVEDEISILKLAEKMLNRLNYKVLTAGLPNEAVALSEKYAGRIQLMLTDMVMPEMDGRELAKQVRMSCPDIKTLYMSGYTASVIARKGGSVHEANFIQKPFSMKDLAAKIHEVLYMT